MLKRLTCDFRPRFWLALLVLAVLVLSMGAVLGLSQNAPSGGDSLPPIVFVSRTRLETLNNYDVGPPTEVLAREMTVGGALYLLRPNLELVALTGPHNGIFDVQRPMVSFDGTRVAFSGVKARNGMWRIFEVNIDGSDLRQVTPDERGVAIPDDPTRRGQNASTFARFGDFSPAYLPDGRIVFSSSRYPSVSGSCGQRALNLYVIDRDGRNMRRLITTRSGAINPYVMANGRIIIGLWFDNMNTPAYDTAGLQPLEDDVNFQSSFLEPWSVNPDGTGAGRLGYTGGLLTHGVGGGIHYREMPNGEIVYTRRASASFLSHPLTSAISKFRPGDGAQNSPEGIGDPAKLDGPHAMMPTPLPDGRILFSYAPDSRAWTDEKHRTLASFDFGLYICDGDFKNIRLLYNYAATDELDAVAVYQREVKTRPEELLPKLPEDPTAAPQGKAVMINRNVYADVDRRFTSNLSPLPGSIVAMDVYDDAQTFYTTPEFPLLRKQMPRLYGSFPVKEDGSVRLELPSDKPAIIVLRGPTGVAARYPGSLGETRTPFFAHEIFRPGEVVSGCSGCHRGHMIRPDINARAKTNLARLAYAVGSSARNASYMGPARVSDSHIGLANGYYQWIPAATDIWPWVRLTWEQRITAREIMIYPRPGVSEPIGDFEIYLSDGKRLSARSDPARPEEPIIVAIPNPGAVTWIHFQLLGYWNGEAPGIAEISVAGDQVRPVGATPPKPVPSVTVTPGTLRLSWARSPSRSVIGYKIFAGNSPDNLPIEWDVSNVTSYQPEYLEAGATYHFRVVPYDAEQFGPPQAKEASGTLVPPRVDRIMPASGPVWGDTDVTIEGDGFVPGLAVKIGGQYLRNVMVVSPQKITGTTYRNSAAFHDVIVRNPGKQKSVLTRAFKHE